MQTLLDILKRAGGWNPGLYLKIENAPYMALVIEATGESGPSGPPPISIAHYGKQNGDLMRAPEMCFELGFVEGPHLELDTDLDVVALRGFASGEVGVRQQDARLDPIAEAVANQRFGKIETFS